MIQVSETAAAVLEALADKLDAANPKSDMTITQIECHALAEFFEGIEDHDKALRGLVTRWRSNARSATKTQAHEINLCADELEEFLGDD